jgi:predicted anti-sigma-YlaC factor YlaD
VLAVTLVTGCPVKKFAINKVADALAESGTTYASDDDPELVGQALPFGLKLIEGLLESSPKHRGLLFAASSGFTQYSYAYIQQEADEVEDLDLERAQQIRARARRLYLRARDYGLRGLETRHKNFATALRADPQSAVRAAKAADVPLLYWTAASWAAAISVSKDNPDLIADQLIVEALIDRAVELNEQFEAGALHGFLISYETSRQGGKGDPLERARKHFRRAVELSGGKLAAPYVALAESVSVAKQDRGEFERLLREALAIDPNAKPEWRLANLIMQRRARWLLARTERLFAE